MQAGPRWCCRDERGREAHAAAGRKARAGEGTSSSSSTRLATHKTGARIPPAAVEAPGYRSCGTVATSTAEERHTHTKRNCSRSRHSSAVEGAVSIEPGNGSRVAPSSRYRCPRRTSMTASACAPEASGEAAARRRGDCAEHW